MSNIEIITDEESSFVPVAESKAQGRVKVRRRGRVAMWLAIVWLVFLTISAIGANSLPYVPHEFEGSTSKCSTAIYGDINRI